VELAKNTGLPIEIWGWCRDEYGSSDGADFQKLGITVTSKTSPEELAEELGREVSGFEVCIGQPMHKIVP